MASPSFSNFEGLAGLARGDGIDIRPTLLRALTDLYVQKSTHTADEERHYTELSLRLLDAVDVSVRKAVAKRLAAYSAAPQAVIAQLTRDVAEVADILKRHDAFTGGNVGESAISSYAAGQRADGKPMHEDLSDLFFAANPAERRLILRNIDFAPIPPASPISEALAAETVARLETAAMTRNGGAFAETVAHACDMPLVKAERIVADPFGEPIVVVAKALAMRADILQRILLFLNPAIGHSVPRFYELAELFDELAPRAARRMIAICRGWNLASRATKHVPIHWDDERRGSRIMATPQPRRIESRLAAERRRLGRHRPSGS